MTAIQVAGVLDIVDEWAFLAVLVGAVGVLLVLVAIGSRLRKE